MLRKSAFTMAGLLVLSLSMGAQSPRRIALGDWPEIRGPQRDGTSRETGLIERWSPMGENLLWRAPFGGRSAPVVMGNRVYVQNPASRGETRSLLLALKMIELRLLADAQDSPPLLLLDDVFSELDAARRQALAELAKSYQTLITTTDADAVRHYFARPS